MTAAAELDDRLSLDDVDEGHVAAVTCDRGVDLLVEDIGDPLCERVEPQRVGVLELESAWTHQGLDEVEGRSIEVGGALLGDDDGQPIDLGDHVAFGVLAGRHQLQVVLESLGAASGDGHLDRQFGLFGLLGELVELATCILGDRQHTDFPCLTVPQALV